MILSGYSKTKDIEEAQDKYLLYKFISKPWDENDLKQTMDLALKQA